MIGCSLPVLVCDVPVFVDPVKEVCVLVFVIVDLVVVDLVVVIVVLVSVTLVFVVVIVCVFVFVFVFVCVVVVLVVLTQFRLMQANPKRCVQNLAFLTSFLYSVQYFFSTNVEPRNWNPAHVPSELHLAWHFASVSRPLSSFI